MATSPRIYNLFPLLVGSVADWRTHLGRIAAMGFDWVYLNPFQYPGFSGSLYAVKDPSRLHPLFQGDSADSPDALLRGFVVDAESHRLRVMMDLVINHTSKDALLVERHPEWFLRDPDGSVKSPGTVDPDDPTKITEWGDLAGIDYHNPGTRPGLIGEWSRLASHYAELGFAGFRCDAAYQVPGEVWQDIIQAVRQTKPDTVFAAETLGCTPEQVESLGGAGFDLLFNSAKWWDFEAPWLLEQYDLYRRIAPSVAFPESHDTPRLVTKAPPGADPAAFCRQRATFAAFFSAGWMIPIGFEFGFDRPIDVVTSRPEDWQEKRFDLSEDIAALNRIKAGIPALRREGPQERLNPPGAAVLVLLRHLPDGTPGALLVLNRDPAKPQGVNLDDFSLGPLDEIFPGNGGGHEGPLRLAPLAARIFVPRHQRDRHPSRQEGGDLPVSGQVPRTITRAIVIEDVSPRLDCGRHAVKREVGDMLEVSADILKEGHDKVAAALLWREQGASQWSESPMRPGDNDRWHGEVRLTRNCRWSYTVLAWPDDFETWRHQFGRKREAAQSITLELIEGRAQVEAALPRARNGDRERLKRILAELDSSDSGEDRADMLQSTMLRQIMARAPDRSRAVRHDTVYEVIVDRPLARFAAWYEIMPRSQGTVPGRASTFAECEKRLDYIADLGFDVVYLLPIHPIGRVHRKGPNNSLVAGPGDPGSPYAIGSDDGGHTAIHPDLGTLDDFRRFVAAAEAKGLDVAMDFAVQCAPDHPWVRQHPEWFQFRPDGTIKYAENPPKKYQDIVNVDFHSEAAPALWLELLEVIEFWVAQGVTIFRVDNPHTKPVPFWEWLIRSVQDKHPRIIFLSEAFTRPKMMRLLAKIGFSQSYTYFTWRNFKEEIIDYMTELTTSESREYFRPNVFPTTPDILPPFLQTGGRPAFRIRHVLAATLSSVYGIYNSYELCEATAMPGKEEYGHSEKYEHKVWDWNRPGHIKDDIRKINRIRKENSALHEFENLRFHPSSDENVLFYGKMNFDRSNMILVAVNLDPFDTHDAVLTFPLREMGVSGNDTFEVEELLSGARHLWRGAGHRVRLDPNLNPAAIYRVTVWTSVDYRSPCL